MNTTESRNLSRFAISLGACLMLVSPTLLAGQKIDQRLDVDSDNYIDIEHMNGKAVVKGWDKDEVYVQGELSDRAEEFVFKRRGNRVEISVEMQHSSYRDGNWKNWKNDEGDDLTIFVPKNSRVQYESINANFDAENLHGGLAVEVVNGHIDVNDMTGRIRLESVNGDIRAQKLSGDVQLETVNGSIEGKHSGKGDISFTSVNGNIDIASDSPEIAAETVNGDLRLELQEVNDLDLSTVNGRVEVSMDLADDGDVRVSSVGGSIELMFQQGVSARFDIEGHAGGRFINRLTDDKTQKDKYGPRRWLEFSTGNGEARVEVSTVNGRVELLHR
ncbi:DUF4097 family beta strand repeat-containing protein [Alteromonas facilis]|uniref:DUF4097 family beta strand repeat-containing protein n=1 Tax=Alteromonas facilis TaxID=2048004 RepID=UPI000C28431D|nr:DUF4097 family beta strand repeat-containing protein [Alteromonas facilis]